MRHVRRGAFLVCALGVVLAGRALCADPAPAGDEGKPDAVTQASAHAKTALNAARALLEEKKYGEAARCLFDAADKIGKDEYADQLRFGAVNVLLADLIIGDGARDAVEKQVEALAGKTTAKNQEMAALVVGDAYVKIGAYDKARAQLGKYLEDYPPPTEQEIEEFEKTSEEPDARHPRLDYREAVQHMLDAITLVGQKPPAFSLTATDGVAVSPEAFQGKVLIVFFWASWCGPCREETPRVRKVYDTYHDQGLEIVGLSLDEDQADLAAFVKEEGVPWKQVFLGGAADDLMSRYKADGVPTIFVVDREGVIRARDLRGKLLAESVAVLMKETLAP